VEPDWAAFEAFDATQPGLVVAVVSGGDVVSWRSCGSATPDGDRLGLDSPLYVASLAKQFTAACVALLVLDGHLGLDDSIGQWLPDLGHRLGGVQIENLLSHTSGLPSSNELDAAAGFGVDHPTTTAERLSVLDGWTLEHEPGTVHRYSNHGFVLLAEIVGRCTGQRLGAFAADRLFEPLGMTRTAFLDLGPREIVPGWSQGSRRVDVRFSCVGDGGLVSSVGDLALWDAWLPTSVLAGLMLRERPVLPDGNRAHNAWGISVRSHHGQRIESHGGAIDGYLAKHVRFAELGTSFIALANTDNYGVGEFDELVHHLADATLANHLDLRQPPWTTTLGQASPTHP
jgi:CubicO group peptidase (beta-lactamase class C family)